VSLGGLSFRDIPMHALLARPWHLPRAMQTTSKEREMPRQQADPQLSTFIEKLPHPASAYAMDLARAFFAFSGGRVSNPAEEYGAVMLAADSLVDSGRAGEWEHFDAASFFRQISFLPEVQRRLIALELIALFFYLSLIEWVSPRRAIRLVSAIEENAARFADLGDVANSARETIRKMAFPRGQCN
jgi:hypothetical protein